MRDAVAVDDVLTARRLRRRLVLVARGAMVIAVLSTVGLCGAIATTGFVKFGCRSKQTEARGALRSLYVAEEAFRAEFDRYADEPTVGGTFTWAPSTKRPRYRHGVAAKNAPGHAQFTAWAVAVDDTIRGDLWTINENNELTHVVDACAR